MPRDSEAPKKNFFLFYFGIKPGPKMIISKNIKMSPQYKKKKKKAEPLPSVRLTCKIESAIDLCELVFHTLSSSSS